MHAVIHFSGVVWPSITAMKTTRFVVDRCQEQHSLSMPFQLASHRDVHSVDHFVDIPHENWRIASTIIYMIKPSGLRARTFTANLCLSMTVTSEWFFFYGQRISSSLSNTYQRASIPWPFCPTKPNIDYRFLPPLLIRYLHVGSKDTACACVPQHNFF